MSTKHNITGYILVAVGALFLLDSLNILHFGHFAGEWWPLILIVVGIMKMRSNSGSGGVLIIIGAVFLSATLGIVNWGRIWRFWPVLLILAGLQIIYQSRGKSGLFTRANRTSDDNYFSFSAIFAGNSHKITSQELRGGDSLALFGGVDIDLTTARPVADKCTLSLTALFGGIDLVVPDNWELVVSGTPIFGSVENKIRRRESSEDKQTVYINTSVLFGSVEINN